MVSLEHFILPQELTVRVSEPGMQRHHQRVLEMSLLPTLPLKHDISNYSIKYIHKFLTITHCKSYPSLIFLWEGNWPSSQALFSGYLNTKQHLYMTTSFKMPLFRIKESYKTARISCQHEIGMAQTLAIMEATNIHSLFVPPGPCHVPLSHMSPQDIMIILWDHGYLE